MDNILQEKEARIHAFKEIFGGSNDSGNLVLETIREFCLADQQAYVPGFPVEHTMFRNGCQQIAIDIQAMINYDLSELEIKHEEGEEEYGVFDSEG